MCVALCVAMTGLPGLVHAQFTKGTYEARFGKADKNRDGKLSRAEAAAGLTPTVNREFGKMDANKDGFVTRQERDAFMRSRQPPAAKK
jgi:hypothetical protein